MNATSPDVRQVLADAAKRERARRHVIPFAQRMDPRWEDALHLLYIADALEALEERRIRRLAVCLPPRHGKTELVARKFVAWYLGRHPDHHVILASYGAEVAESNSRAVRAMVGDNYFIDEHLGLCYLRVPTWCPFRLQFYCNGHFWLAAELSRRQIPYRLADNAFAGVANFSQAQQIADGLRVHSLHRKLDAFVRRYCPAIAGLGVTYHWSIDQAEYSTDIIFRRQGDLQAIYDRLTRTAIHTVKPENVATFLGRKLSGNYQDELGNRFDTRIEGTRIKHTMGPVSLKMYDKHGFILRIETTVNDVSFFKHYRRVEHRDGTTQTKWTSMKKGLYTLPALREVLRAANRRYLEFISAIDTPTAGIDALRKISGSLRQGEHTYPGFNLFCAEDQALMDSLVRGEYCIRGLSNKAIRKRFPHKTSAQVSRMLKRLRIHGLIKKVGRTYHYYLTHLGRTVAIAGIKIKELVLIPQLAAGLG